MASALADPPQTDRVYGRLRDVRENNAFINLAAIFGILLTPFALVISIMLGLGRVSPPQLPAVQVAPPARLTNVFVSGSYTAVAVDGGTASVTPRPPDFALSGDKRGTDSVATDRSLPRTDAPPLTSVTATQLGAAGLRAAPDEDDIAAAPLLATVEWHLSRLTHVRVLKYSGNLADELAAQYAISELVKRGFVVTEDLHSALTIVPKALIEQGGSNQGKRVVTPRILLEAKWPDGQYEENLSGMQLSGIPRSVPNSIQILKHRETLNGLFAPLGAAVANSVAEHSS